MIRAIINSKTHLRNGILAILAIAASLGLAFTAYAGTLTSSSVKLSDSRPNASANSVQYDTKFTFPGTTAIGCIRIQFTTTAAGSTVPTGMSTTSATKASVSGGGLTNGSWTLTNTTNGLLEYKHATTEATSTATPAEIKTASITNPNSAATHYARVTTYSSSGACTTELDTTTVALTTADGQAVSLTVDPSLTFTIAGKASGTTCNGATTNEATTASTIPLGTPTIAANRIGAQDVTVTTNAGNGYTVHTRYTAQPTSGGNTINDHTGSNASPTAFSVAGTEAFGYTTNDATLGTGTADRFTNGGPKWAAFTTSNATSEVAFSSAAASSQTTCVGYQTGIAGTTEAGTYTTTVIFTATPVF